MSDGDRSFASSGRSSPAISEKSVDQPTVDMGPLLLELFPETETDRRSRERFSKTEKKGRSRMRQVRSNSSKPIVDMGPLLLDLFPESDSDSEPAPEDTQTAYDIDEPPLIDLGRFLDDDEVWLFEEGNTPRSARVKVADRSGNSSAVQTAGASSLLVAMVHTFSDCVESNPET